ncbi:TetR/AcrR family transcriptional regulator [Gordonia sp. HY002]|uniref:TetR/AcrR family transcriptional regulator n=1 Tax=Gordonia zhenghanii TaxID=2911516 RepID=UPI001EF09371|nr:TetR/AcrR family transcriptional regulator [Gordonia zhenghanii]MCF8571336.1 TetR/AcrR family transcriptional regulator [Gordonia zhenghanii]MCF8601860.1 TetR/AcrR family transcriptional regulator [Gordonia zhenghanii]
MTQRSFARRRPREFDGTTTAEQAVFDATERLLADTSLQDLTVAQILPVAGLSRANFYHYFASKHDVLVALVARIFDQSYGGEAPWSSSPGRDRARQMGLSLASTLEMWSQHGAVIGAVIEHMHSQPAVGAAWQKTFARFVDTVAGQIRYEREAGRAPDGAPAEMVASLLVGAVERTFYVSTRGLDPRLPAVEDIADSLRALNEAAIYGGRVATDAADADPAASQISVDLPASTTADDELESETPQAILKAMRELLVDCTLAELSVAKVLAKAGTSRASFYFYFRSKEDAFVALFRHAAVDVVAGLRGLVDIDRSDPEAMSELVVQWLSLEGFTGPIIRNAVHEWPRLPELRDEYLTAMTAMETTLEAVIETDRARGLAPEGPPARQFAATLLWAVERAVAGSLAREDHLEDLQAVIGMVGTVLFASIYGRRAERVGS